MARPKPVSAQRPDILKYLAIVLVSAACIFVAAAAWTDQHPKNEVRCTLDGTVSDWREAPLEGLDAVLHAHTSYSDGKSTPLEVIEQAVKENVDVIAITDHNTIDGALEANKIALERGMRLQVIIGEEVSTDKGDVLAYFLTSRIAPGNIDYVLAQAKSQGAVTAAAHPYDARRSSINLEGLEKRTASRLDAIEVFNHKTESMMNNDRAFDYAVRNGKAMFAGSDAHAAAEIKDAYVVFETADQISQETLISERRMLCRRITGSG